MSEKRIIFSQSSVIIFVMILKLSTAILFTGCGNKVKEEMRSQKDEAKENSSDPKNESGSDKKKTDLKYYFPVSVSNEKNSSIADASRLSTFSSTMLKAGEPVLYSFNQNTTEVYRLLKFNGFDKCTIVSLNKDQGKIWLSVKVLSRAAFLKPQSGGNFVPALNNDGSLDTNKSIDFTEYETMADIPVKLELLSNSGSEQSQPLWDNMTECIKGSGYFGMQSYSSTPPESKKSVYWILEARIGGIYHIVERPDAVGEFRKCCNYLIDLTSK